jgi:hypothetical protein
MLGMDYIQCIFVEYLLALPRLNEEELELGNQNPHLQTC